jgi:tetratricopeptide (TPR) repeat protein
MYVKLGLRLFDTEIYDEAEELFRKAWNGRRSVFGRKELPTLRVEVNLACSLSKLQRYEDAAECFREALAG